MHKRKKKTRRGNFLSKVMRSKKVKAVRSKIKRKKAELKKLSSDYRSAVKTVSKKLSR